MSGKVPWLKLTVVSAGSTQGDVFSTEANSHDAYTVMGLGYTLFSGESTS